METCNMLVDCHERNSGLVIFYYSGGIFGNIAICELSRPFTLATLKNHLSFRGQFERQY